MLIHYNLWSHFIPSSFIKITFTHEFRVHVFITLTFTWSHANLKIWSTNYSCQPRMTDGSPSRALGENGEENKHVDGGLVNNPPNQIYKKVQTRELINSEESPLQVSPSCRINLHQGTSIPTREDLPE